MHNSTKTTKCENYVIFMYELIGDLNATPRHGLRLGLHIGWVQLRLHGNRTRVPLEIEGVTAN